MRIGIGESFAQQCVGTFEHPPTARASPSWNDSNPRSRRLCQTVAMILDFVRRSWAKLVFDELPSGNHRREREGATRGGGAYGAYKFATKGGGGWGPGHADNVATTSRPIASARFSPRAPAPAAPPLTAQYAIRRDRSDENSPSPRCSKPPPTQHPQQSAYDNRNRRLAARRWGGSESTRRPARARNGRRRRDGAGRPGRVRSILEDRVRRIAWRRHERLARGS
jgi:hypothetical protein